MYARTGQTLSMSALPRLLWLAERLPAVYEATASVGMIGDWILARLGAVRAVDRPARVHHLAGLARTGR